MDTNRIVLAVGSNVADGDSKIKEAVDVLRKYVRTDGELFIYTTPPVGGVGNDYFNAVVAGETSSGLNELSELSKMLERQMGRDEVCRSAGIVPVDVDIVIFNGELLRPRDFAQNYFRIGYDRLPSVWHIMI